MAALSARAAALPIAASPRRPEPPCLKLLLHGLLDRSAQRSETGIEITGDLRPQCAPAALGKNIVIATRLRRLDDAKRIGLSGHRQVRGIVARDLQKDAAVWSALVGLSGRMLETRPEADTGRRR